jgi:DNA-binding response OmpR family regulator
MQYVASSYVCNAEQADMVASWRQETGNRVTIYACPQMFISDLEFSDYDLLLFGWCTENKSQSSRLLNRIVQMGKSPGRVIVLAESADEQYIVSAFNSGADRVLYPQTTYVVLQALVTSLQRRFDEKNQHIDFHPYRVNLLNYVVDFPGGRQRLSRIEFLVMSLLIERRNRFVPRKELLFTGWAITYSPTRRLDVLISKLKNKLSLRGEFGWRLNYSRSQKAYGLKSVS